MYPPDDNTLVTMLDHALKYASRGWKVIPLHTPNPNSRNGCSCKQDGCSIGKHPRTKNGLKDATTDPKQIEAWWRQWPDANIAIATGEESGLFVLDIDYKNKGSETLAALALDIGDLPPTLTATTGDGRHPYFNYPDEGGKNTTGKLGEGLDTRGDGGYVVAPPSLHKSGTRYAWANQEPLADLRPAYLDRLSAKTTGRIDHHAPVKKGMSNTSLHKYASSLRGQEAMEYDDLVPVLLNHNAGYESPMTTTRVIGVAKSVCKLYPAIRGKRSHGSPVWWFKLNVPEWLAKTATMSDYQRGWYLQLKAIAYQEGGYLPNDMKSLAKYAGAKSEKAFVKDCYEVLREFEQIDIDGTRMLVHPQLAEEYAAALNLVNIKKRGVAVREANRDARKAGLPIPIGLRVLADLKATLEIAA